MSNEVEMEEIESNDNGKKQFYPNNLKDITKTLQSIVTIIAIISAFIWFIMKSEASQRANINYDVSNKQIHEKWNWIRAAIAIENIGNLPIDLGSVIVRIQKIIPLDDDLNNHINRNEHLILNGDLKVNWPIIEKPYKVDLKHKIYPGEKDCIDVEFIIPSYIKTVRIYSYFERQSNPPFGWSKATIYDLK